MMRMLERLWTGLGAVAVLATLLLSVPGPRIVRADAAELPVLTSEDPALQQAAFARDETETASPPAGPACRSAAAHAGLAPDLETRLAAKLGEIRAVGPLPGVDPSKAESAVMVLNGRGYNYGSGQGSGVVENLLRPREPEAR